MTDQYTKTLDDFSAVHKCHFQFLNQAPTTGFTNDLEINLIGENWKDVRKQISLKVGLIKKNQRKFRTFYKTILRGYLWPHDRLPTYAECLSCPKLHNIDRISSGNKIILKRECNTWSSLQHIRDSDNEEEDDYFRKPKFDLNFNDEMTEEEKMMAIMCQSQFLGNNTNQEKKVPPYYICDRCKKQGDHYFKYCPTWQDSEFVPENKRSVAHGILQHQLREAVTEEEKKRAMINPKDFLSLVVFDEKFVKLDNPKNFPPFVTRK